MFEKQNPNIPGINVFSINAQNKIYPLRLSEKDCQRSIDLFLYEKKWKTSLSSWIKDFGRLLNSHISDKQHKKVLLQKCLDAFGTRKLLNKHTTYCSNNDTVAVTMPAKNTYLNFENHHKKLPLPVVAYADFECLTKPMNNCKPDWNRYQKHEPCGFCLYIKPLIILT